MFWGQFACQGVDLHALGANLHVMGFTETFQGSSCIFKGVICIFWGFTEPFRDSFAPLEFHLNILGLACIVWGSFAYLG